MIATCVDEINHEMHIHEQFYIFIQKRLVMMKLYNNQNEKQHIFIYQHKKSITIHFPPNQNKYIDKINSYNNIIVKTCKIIN